MRRELYWSLFEAKVGGLTSDSLFIIVSPLEREVLLPKIDTMKSTVTSLFLLACALVVAQTDSNLPVGNKARLIAPGIILTTNGEYSPTFDSDSNELIFMRRTPGQFDYTLYSSRWLIDETRWTRPEILPFSGKSRDGGPYFAPDGQTLVFDSRRPDKDVVTNSINLWITTRNSGGWTEPELLLDASRNDASESRDGVFCGSVNG